MLDRHYKGFLPLFVYYCGPLQSVGHLENLPKKAALFPGLCLFTKENYNPDSKFSLANYESQFKLIATGAKHFWQVAGFNSEGETFATFNI